jgi:hypothetical protein
VNGLAAAQASFPDVERSWRLLTLIRRAMLRFRDHGEAFAPVAAW